MSAPGEADLRRMFERSPIGMYRSTVDGRFVFVNPALVALLGYASADELLGIDLSTELYVDPEARQPLVEHYLSAGVVDGVDVRWRRKDGSIITVRIYGHTVSEHDDFGAGFDVTVFDVTALRAAEAEVLAQRTETQAALLKLRSLMKQLPALVWTVDRELRFTSAEGTLFEIRGDDLRGVVGRTLPDVVGDRPSALAAVMHHRAAFGGATAHFEFDWDDKLFLMTVAPMRDPGGAITAVIGAAVDVTAMRRMERNVQTTQRIESLGILAGGVAHDFNNLLVAILGNADLALREAGAAAGDRTALQAIRVAALRASELTSQLLAYTGRGQLVVGELELGDLVEEMVSLLSSGRTATVRLDLAPALPRVHADAAQLRQVVMNLITNAFDSLAPTGGGEVRVRTRVVTLGVEPHPLDVITPPVAGDYVALEVGDTGVGMDSSTRRKIFDPF
ncbi:MAG: PAS domain S-box protein, partial [Myxococcales bacterium]|nr:PAS domain S-box protein [Myxococcales bacterium]